MAHQIRGEKIQPTTTCARDEKSGFLLYPPLFFSFSRSSSSFLLFFEKEKKNIREIDQVIWRKRERREEREKKYCGGVCRDRFDSNSLLIARSAPLLYWRQIICIIPYGLSTESACLLTDDCLMITGPPKPRHPPQSTPSKSLSLSLSIWKVLINAARTVGWNISCRPKTGVESQSLDQ